MHSRRWPATWLAGFLFLILLMISVGGVTRLTRSGLSIAEWKPVMGALPPLSEKDWQEQFDLYQKTPEYQKVNSQMTLGDYKEIFFWEYFHRNLGRFLFLYVLGAGLWLWRRRLVAGRWVILLSSLVAFQGLIGWLMVKSGLNKEPHVSPYLLALHFFFALSVLTTAFKFLANFLKPFEIERTPTQKFLLISLGLTIALQIFYGCLTSGLKAGFAFNTYPLMGNDFFPPAAFNLEPSWLNIFENPITVQWIHRWTAILVLILLLTSSWHFIRFTAAPKRPFWLLIGLGAIQVTLGITTLVGGVPLVPATLHQLTAALIVLGYFNILFRWSSSGQCSS